MSLFPDDIEQLAKSVLAECRSRGFKIATAESCTGGLIAAALTEIAGSSDVVDRGFVTYSNEAKERMLGVSAALLASVGAVSEATARCMAAGALENSQAQIAVAVTGIAGPGGGTSSKPVGLVHVAAGTRQGVVHKEFRFTYAERGAIRLATVRAALTMMLELVSQSPT